MPNGISTAYRFVVEGLGLEAVTDPAMETPLADGRARVLGLLRDGLAIEEEVDLARGEVESSPMSIAITDRPHDSIWTQYLAHRPAVRTWLQSNIAASGDVTFNVDSTAGFAEGDIIHIGTEAMELDAVNGDDEFDVISSRRGYWQTVPQAHYITAGEELARPVITLDRPLSLEGRRCFLYRYVLGESMVGNGTLIWRGVLSTDAKLSAEGTTWSLLADPITELLKQDLGGDLEDPFSIRGIYYPGTHPFRATLYELAGDNWIDRSSPANVSAIKFRGFFETQEDFCDALQAEINTAITGWSSPSFSPGSITVAPHSSGTWVLDFTTGGGTAKWLRLDITHPIIDGECLPSAPRAEWESGLTADQRYSLVAGQRASVRGAAMVPRGYFGHGAVGGEAPGPAITTSVDESPTAFHPDGLANLDEGDVVTLEFPEDDEPGEYEVSSADDSARAYLLRSLADSCRAYTFASLPEARVRRRYASGTLEDFRAALIAASPSDVNRGASPLLTSDELADWSAPVARAAVHGFQQRRSYASTQAADLAELLSHECRLLGLFPRIDSDGKIGLAYLELPTATAVVSRHIGPSEILVDEDPPSWERNAFGSINTVTFKTQYDVVEDEHTGPTYLIRDVTGLSIRKKSRMLEVEPKTRALGGVPDPRLVTDAMQRVLGVFGRPYSVVKIEVPHTVMVDVNVGDVITLTTPRIPDSSAGTRGIEAAAGLITARSWDLATERGRLTIIVSEQRLAGYTPSARITAAPVLVGGDEYDVPVDFRFPGSSNSMAPVGATTGDFFAVDDQVEVMIWDATTQTPQSGIVTAVVDALITIDFDAAPTFTGDRYIRFAPAASVIAANQRRFAYLADSDSLVSFSSGDETAKEFSA